MMSSENNNKDLSSYTIHIVDYPSYTFETIISSGDNVTFHLLNGKVHIFNGNGKEYLFQSPGESLKLCGTARITVFGENEAYYAIVQYWNVPTTVTAANNASPVVVESNLPAKSARARRSSSQSLTLKETLQHR